MTNPLELRAVLIISLLYFSCNIDCRYPLADIAELTDNGLEEQELEDLISRGVESDVVLVPDSVWEEEANYTATHSDGKYVRQFGSNQPAPVGTCLTVKIVYDRNWVRQAGGGNEASGLAAANNVVAQAQAIFNWNSLQCGPSNSACRIKLQLAQSPVYERSSTWTASGNSLRSSGIRRHIGGSNIDHHAFLTGSNGGGPIGIAYLGTACIRSPRDFSYKTSITEWTGSSDTARTLAHEIGHALRMEHDFEHPNKRDRQGRPCTGINSIMDYTRNENKWSPCSTQDFRDFYNRELVRQRFFCMQKTCNGVVPTAGPTVQPAPTTTPCRDRLGFCQRIAGTMFGTRFCRSSLGERLCRRSCNRC